MMDEMQKSLETLDAMLAATLVHVDHSRNAIPDWYLNFNRVAQARLEQVKREGTKREIYLMDFGIDIRKALIELALQISEHESDKSEMFQRLEF